MRRPVRDRWHRLRVDDALRDPAAGIGKPVMGKTIACFIAADVAAAGLLFGVGAVPAGAGASPGPAGNAGSAGAGRHSPAPPFGMSALTYQRMMEQVPLDNAAEKIRRTAAGSAAGTQSWATHLFPRGTTRSRTRPMTLA
jgi:hypothetical protein